MANALRSSTLETLGLGSPLQIFAAGRLPVDAAELVDRVFGPASSRGALVISGANGIVGAGKVMQLGSRLEPFGIPIVGLDFPNAPDGVSPKYAGLVSTFGRDRAAAIMSNVVRLNYDGRTLPASLAGFKPRMLLEAIPEVLEIKKAHYATFRAAFPDIEIRSVTSGFPSRELGVGIAHPAFPHEINKVYETVEESPSAITQLLWALGLLPMAVSDDWSFVLDVLFCGVTNASLRYHAATNMPYWKIDKYVRKYFGPNPLRAHDAIGAKGANFLTWSCLHHLSGEYGELFAPTADLVERKDTGQNWYPPNHFRPLVDWSMVEGSPDEERFTTWVGGAVMQMTALMVKEQRSHFAQINAIGELCAQFRQGVMAAIRELGADKAIACVQAYHQLHPAAAASAWHPEVFERIGEPEWQQLYVNAEHDGTVGVIAISRESYNHDVDAELNRAIDWLKAAGIDRVIVSGDFHLSTQMVGADTSEFFPALSDVAAGEAVSSAWSRTARRLHTEFATSVGVVTGKRCLGGMLELMTHCHFVLATDGTQLGFPEVTLPVVPGMEGCHWPFRKATEAQWPRLVQLLLTGRAVGAGDAVGWLIDFAGPMDAVLSTAWALASGKDAGVARRSFADGALSGVPTDVPGLPAAGGPATEAARRAIMATIQASCGAPLSEALAIQSGHSARFMVTDPCTRGVVGGEYTKTMKV
jgi:enoyl-CoA hydratase/carnithine racemase/3-hydroxyacyl-CoA dehydrogenase